MRSPNDPGYNSVLEHPLDVQFGTGASHVINELLGNLT